ncbi:helix-turn-helix domain-containing protein [Marasmitruncus massiliensis]|uniref:helix-turn-helix domain-containing protein n=1 Tax=Marasmitruncus massiliensis TaxID=1944642 RepID=UPI0015E0DABA|nr:AraC family transcriptional regulator [Marasmitruncus massiliensis]
MVKEFVFSPHCDFFIDKAHRESGYDMRTFHLHKKYEIYYQEEGCRKYFINDAVYLVNAGNVVILGRDEVHKTSSVDDTPYTRYVLNFNSEYIEDVAKSLGNVDLLSFFDEGIKVLTVSMKMQGMVQSLLTRLMEARTSPEGDAEPFCRVLLLELLFYLKGCVAEQKSRQENAPILSNKTIDKISSYIARNYQSSLTLPEIAARFYISPFYLSRLFKKTTNLTLVEYINSVRIRAARNLLETTHLRISAIAEQTGFSTTAHFSRIFKEGTGVSPQKYRKFYHLE